MTVSSIGSGNYYMGQMFSMQSRAASGGAAGQMVRGAGAGRGPDPAEMFAKVDSDGNGGLDKSEFQTLADGIGAATGQTVDVEELFATYDADGDGVLNEEETQTAMEANRPQGPPPGGMMGGMGAMQGGAPPGFAQMFSDADEDEDGSLDESEVQSLADTINQATGQEVDVEELFATYDADGDGVLNEEETQAALEANRPQGPPPPPSKGMGGETERSQPGLSAGIANYLKSASLGQNQQQNSQMFSSFGGNYNSAGVHTMVNTRI